MKLPKFKTSLVIKLASIAVHADEMMSPGGHEYDRHVIVALLADPEVHAMLTNPSMRMYLPVKRSA